MTSIIFYLDILGLQVGVGTERELQVDGKTTKLNVIAIEPDGYFISMLYYIPFYFCLNNDFT